MLKSLPATGFAKTPTLRSAPRAPKAGFASEIAEFHENIVLQITMEEFKAATIAKARASGATDAQIEAIEFYSDILLDATSQEVIGCPLEDFGFKYTRFGRQANAPRFFAVYRDPFDEEIFQIRTSWQRWDTKKGKYGKPYLFQAGANPLYTIEPELPVADDLHVVTEGKDKACFLAANGYLATSFTGAFGGYRTKDADGKPVAAYLNPKVKERFAAVGVEKIVLWLDSDENPKTRAKVAKAIHTQAQLLEAEGYQVFVAEHDSMLGKGLDDAGMAIAEADRAAWLKQAIEGALTHEQWRKRDYKAGLMQKLLWLNANSVAAERITNGRYIPGLPTLAPGTIHLVQSTGTGDGKTTAIGGSIAKNKAAGGFTLALMPTNSVGKQAAQAWGLPHRHDFHDNQNNLFLGAAVEAGGCVMCPDSMHRLSSEILARVDLVVIDEANQVCDGLTSGGTLGARQSDILAIFANLLRDVIARGGSIVLSEVTVYQRTIDFVKTLAECPHVRLFDHQRASFEPWHITLYTGSASGFVAELLGAIASGKKLILGVTSQQQGEKIHRIINRQLPHKKVVRLDSKTNDGGAFDAFWDDPNQWLRDQGIPDLLIISPSGKSGVSITEPGVDEVWGHFAAHNPDLWRQLIGRYRLPVPRKIFAVPRVIAYSGDERLCSVRGAKARMISNRANFAKMHGLDLAARMIDSATGGEDVDRLLAIETATIDFLAAERTASGIQKALAKDYFVSLMETQGHIIAESKIEKCEATQEALVEIQKELWKERAEILAGLQEGDEKKSIPTWHKDLLAEKVRARSEFPGVDFDDAENCYQALAKDWGKMARGVQLQAAAEHLAAAQSLEKCEVEAILSRKLKLPHNLPKRLLRAKIIELTGVLMLLDGSSYHNEDERAIAIKEKALKWKSEISYWLGLEIKPSQTPVEICNKLLIRLGLKAEAIARPGTQGKRDRIYQVPGVADPFRDLLIKAARQRLEAAEAEPPEADYDEASVEDGMAMVRGAADDEELKAVWGVLESLPEPARQEIRRRAA